MASKLGIIIADFNTSLAVKISVGDTTGTLLSATDDDGVALPAGHYYFTIDGDNANKEHISCDLSSTALTNIKSVSRQGVETSGVNIEHRIGALVTITDFAHIKMMNDILKGTTDLDYTDPLKYDGTAVISDNAHLATKKYADDLAIAGAPDMSLVTKGISEEATAAEINAGTQTGGTGAELTVNPKYLKDSEYYTQRPTAGEKAALPGNNTDIAVGSGNKFMTQTGEQKNAEKYAADSGTADAMVVTLSPVPTSLVAGMIIYVKAKYANATTTPTINVNSLGAKTIVSAVSTALTAGDIAANQFITLIYDGTNFVLQNGVSTSQVVSHTNKITVDTTTRTSSFNIVIPANTLGTNNAVRIKIFGYANGGNTSSASISMGGSSFLNGGANSWVINGCIETIISANGATNSQIINSVSNALSGYNGVYSYPINVYSGTSSFDSTQNYNFAVTIANTNATTQVYGYTVEVIRN